MKRFWTFVLFGLIFVNFLFSEYKQEITKYFDGRKIKKIMVDNVNGGIELKKWEKSEIYVFVKKTSRSQAILEKTDVIFEETRNELRIRVKKKDGWRIFGGSVANVEIVINTPSPRDISLSTVNGALRIYDIEGNLSVSSVNGDISVYNHIGEIESETVNGSINLYGIHGKLKGETVNGSINAEFIEIGEHVELNTVNGSIRLRIENLDDAEVKAETINGAVNIEEFQKPVKRLTLKKRSVYFILGEGRKKIDIETVNGSIKISSSSRNT